SHTGSDPRSRPPSQPAPKSQPLYGIVQYDFVAERADELDAKRGEPIIVIAQSNHEWFVAKPIGRLGGPGLIPVAFVEIQDMTTGKPVENVEELIRSAVVPKVEEWKKMTADYKSASIPLGRFDFATSNGPSKPSPADSSFGQQQKSSNGGQHAYRPPGLASPAQEEYSPPLESERSSAAYEEEDRDPNARYSWTQERRQYGLVTSASVESFHQEEGSFWFHLRAFFSTGASLVLYRLYQDFYEFQIGLMDEFPVEAGRVPPGGEGSTRPLERILPMMPGPTDFEDEVVCAQRVHDLSIYLGDLCALPDRIRGTGLMYEFFVPRAGDVEVAVGNGKGDVPSQERVSIEGQYGELVEYLDQMDRPEVRASRDVMPDVGGLSLNGGDQSGQHHEASGRQSAASKASSGAGYSDPRGSHQYADTHQQQSQQHHKSYQQAYPSPPPPQAVNNAPLGNANINAPYVKIKIFHRNTDDLIAIRVPPTVSHASLLEKVRERLGSDVVNLRFREEVGSQSGPAGGGQVVMAGGARLIGIDTDSELERWIRGGTRLVLREGYVVARPSLESNLNAAAQRVEKETPPIQASIPATNNMSKPPPGLCFTVGFGLAVALLSPTFILEPAQCPAEESPRPDPPTASSSRHPSSDQHSTSSSPNSSTSAPTSPALNAKGASEPIDASRSEQLRVREAWRAVRDAAGEDEVVQTVLEQMFDERGMICLEFVSSGDWLAIWRAEQLKADLCTEQEKLLKLKAEMVAVEEERHRYHAECERKRGREDEELSDADAGGSKVHFVLQGCAEEEEDAEEEEEVEEEDEEDQEFYHDSEEEEEESSPPLSPPTPNLAAEPDDPKRLFRHVLPAHAHTIQRNRRPSLDILLGESDEEHDASPEPFFGLSHSPFWLSKPLPSSELPSDFSPVRSPISPLDKYKNTSAKNGKRKAVGKGKDSAKLKGKAKAKRVRIEEGELEAVGDQGVEPGSSVGSVRGYGLRERARIC
ncbi:bud emergence protein 1, partial [Phenoliferia sp. Uapishka_3]